VEPVDRLGQRGEVGALDGRGLVALDLRRLADADHLGAAGLLGAGGQEPPQRLLGRARQRTAVGEQDRRAQRRCHQLRSGDRHAPVGRVDERDGGRPRVVAARRIDRLRDPGRVGDRVGAADAGRVHGRERGEAELCRGLLLVALLAEHRRLLRGRVGDVVVAAVTAAAAREEQREQHEQKRRAERGAHAHTR
jgi:hypothetical protein